MVLGFRIIICRKDTSTKRARSIGNDSWGGFFHTAIWIHPQEELITILLLQVYTFKNWEMVDKFERLIYQLT